MKKGRALLMVPVTSMVKHPPLFPDLGLGYVATALKNSGHNVCLRSWNMDPSAENFKGYLKKNRFDLIGVKVFTKDVAAANKTIRMIKAESPDSSIVVGGPHPSTSEPYDVMEDFNECDFAIRGEAEAGFPLLIEHIVNNGKGVQDGLEKIPGLVWKSEGQIRYNPPYLSPYIDSLGFPLWDMMHPRDYKTPKIPGAALKGNSAPIIVTRGCSALCSYCAAFKISGKAVRSRSSASVLSEIDMLYNKYDVRHLFFMDTRFMQKDNVVAEICEGILEHKMELAWDCIGYEDLSCLNLDLLTLMKKAGCRLINMGIESGSEKTRQNIRKTGRLSEIREKIRIVKEAGIGVRAFFMIGFWGETKADMKDTADFAFSIPADSLQFEIACPHPGTDLLNSLKTKYRVDRINWENFDIYKSPYPLAEARSDELLRILKSIRRKYMFLSLKRKIVSLWDKQAHSKL